MCQPHSVDLKPTEEILRRYPPEARHLISVLQDVQLAYRYLPQPALEAVARALCVPLAKVYGVATFYKTFSLTPRGEKVLRCCTGTACHIRGAPLIGGLIAQSIGYPALFGTSLFFAAVGLFVLTRRVKEPRHMEKIESIEASSETGFQQS